MDSKEAIWFEILNELHAAQTKFRPFNSEHEGYAVLLEEVEELWAEVKKSPRNRRPDALRAEAIQVAAMAVRFLLDRCPKKVGAP
jgi:hypothetical protein